MHTEPDGLPIAAQAAKNLAGCGDPLWLLRSLAGVIHTVCLLHIHQSLWSSLATESHLPPFLVATTLRHCNCAASFRTCEDRLTVAVVLSSTWKDWELGTLA